MARKFECQATELHLRVALLNRFTQLERRCGACGLHSFLCLSWPALSLCNKAL